MTIARIRSFAFSGIEAVPVEVQVQIAGGLPAFLVVGLADKAVGEARERVRAALHAMGLALPPKRVLINLAPADLVKEGSHFDLPIALGVLAAMEVLPRDEMAGYAALGELSLDGAVNAVAGVLPAASARRRRAGRPPVAQSNIPGNSVSRMTAGIPDHLVVLTGMITVTRPVPGMWPGAGGREHFR